MARENKPTSVPVPLITLTGEAEDRSYVVRVRGRPAKLTGNCLSALVKLIVARAGAGSPYVAINKDTVYRLRKTIEGAARAPSAGKLIHTAPDGDYRLGVEANELHDAVAIERPFFHLAKHGLV